MARKAAIMSGVLQTETHTAVDRYPDLFQAAAAVARLELRPGPLKILSFGCSLGAELETLAGYFPKAQLFGCDINDAMIEAARARMGDRATVFKSSEDGIGRHGPFDMVFALSVLCLYGRDERRIKTMLPFAAFEGAVAQLDRALGDPGLLVLYNTSYKPRDSSILASYSPILHPALAENGFVHKYDRSSVIAASRIDDQAGYYDLLRPAEFLDDDFTDVLLLKSARRSGRHAYCHLMNPLDVERLRPSLSVETGRPSSSERELRVRKTVSRYHGPEGQQYRVTRAQRRAVPHSGIYHHPPLVEQWSGDRFRHLDGELVRLDGGR